MDHQPQYDDDDFNNLNEWIKKEPEDYDEHGNSHEQQEEGLSEGSFDESDLSQHELVRGILELREDVSQLKNDVSEIKDLLLQLRNNQYSRDGFLHNLQTICLESKKTIEDLSHNVGVLPKCGILPKNTQTSNVSSSSSTPRVHSSTSVPKPSSNAQSKSRSIQFSSTPSATSPSTANVSQRSVSLTSHSGSVWKKCAPGLVVSKQKLTIKEMKIKTEISSPPELTSNSTANRQFNALQATNQRNQQRQHQSQQDVIKSVFPSRSITQIANSVPLLRDMKKEQQQLQQTSPNTDCGTSQQQQKEQFIFQDPNQNMNLKNVQSARSKGRERSVPYMVQKPQMNVRPVLALSPSSSSHNNVKFMDNLKIYGTTVCPIPPKTMDDMKSQNLDNTEK